jgi:hypothetical protein
MYGDPCRLLGLTDDFNPVYAIPANDHNGLPPVGQDQFDDPAFELFVAPRNIFNPTTDESGDNPALEPENLDAVVLESSEWDDLVETPPQSRSECIEALGEFTWHDTTTTLQMLSSPSLDAFPEHFKQDGLRHHLVGVTTTGLAYYDTEDMPYFTICTVVDGSVQRWHGESSHISINGISTNHLPYAQYLARVELEGDQWEGLTSLGRSYLRDYLDSMNDLSSLLDD